MLLSLEGIDMDPKDVDLPDDTIRLSKIVRLFDGEDKSSDKGSSGSDGDGGDSSGDAPAPRTRATGRERERSARDQERERRLERRAIRRRRVARKS